MGDVLDANIGHRTSTNATILYNCMSSPDLDLNLNLCFPDLDVWYLIFFTFTWF